MSHLINKRLSLALVGAAMGLAVAASAPAQAQGINTTLQYEQATEAQNKCVGELTQAQEDRAAEIGTKAGNFDFLVGDFVTAMDGARGQTRVERFSLGCNSPYIVERLNFWKTNIQPYQ